jgi:ribonucleotide monophosphatase NagD (HAD superfamily)
LTFSNPDLFWAAEYPLPRLGQGGFRTALEGIWREMTDGVELEKLVIGKPSRVTYNFAEKVLRKHRKQMLADHYGSSKDFGQLRKVFMIGDNPESDIKGANDFDNPKGTRWESILLKTGVWQDGRPPKYQPKMICENVEAAVRWALEKEGLVYTDEQFPRGQD